MFIFPVSLMLVSGQNVTLMMTCSSVAEHSAACIATVCSLSCEKSPVCVRVSVFMRVHQNGGQIITEPKVTCLMTWCHANRHIFGHSSVLTV